MSQRKLWMIQLVKYFIISKNYAQISFVNANREKKTDSMWLVNPENEYMAVHVSIDDQYITFARKEQIKLEAMSIFNAFGRGGKILDISFDEKGEYKVIEDTTYIALYPQCTVPEEISSKFPNLSTLIYDVDNPEAEIRKNNDEIKAFLLKKVNTQRPRQASWKAYRESLSGTYIIGFILSTLIYGTLYLVSTVKDINITYLGLAFGAYFKPYIVALNQWYRLLTAGFMHLSLFHILANLIALKPISKAVETKLGFKKTFITFIVSIITGSLFIYFGNGNEIAVGMSGGIYGLMGVLIVLFYQEGLFKIPAIRQRFLSTMYLNIILNFLPNISMLGHLGGFVAGIFLGFIFSEKTEKTLKLNFIICGSILAGFMIGYCIMFHSVSNVFPAVDTRVIRALRQLNMNSYADRIKTVLQQYY